MGLLQGPRLMAWTTKSLIRGNHWVPLGCRALLGSVNLISLYFQINEMGKDIEMRLRQTSENLGDKQKIKNKATSRAVTKTVLVAVNFFLVCNISDCLYWLIEIAQGKKY